MNLKELESRVMALEKSVESLEIRLLNKNGKAQAPSTDGMDPAKQRQWWVEDAGKYKDDPDFKMAMRLGRKYRKSHDGPRRKKKTVK